MANKEIAFVTPIKINKQSADRPKRKNCHRHHNTAATATAPAMHAMISTLTRSAARRPAVALHLFQRGFAQQAAAVGNVASAQTPTFSTMAARSEVSDAIGSDSAQGKGTITKTLKALDMAVVRQIKAELLSVDQNNDGRQVPPAVMNHAAFPSTGTQIV
jgi:hypothetical protein